MKLTKILSIISAVSIIGANAVCVNADNRKTVTTGIYYSENGKLLSVKNFTANLDNAEAQMLINVSKPDGADKAKLSTFDADNNIIETADAKLNSHDINIISTGDMRGHLVDDEGVIGIDKVAALKKLLPNSLLFDAGDATQGISYAALTRGEDVIFTMNTAGYDGMVLGNHEFDYGFETLLTNVSLASFPVMAANIAFPQREDERYIEIPASHIYDIGEHKVGVFGIITRDTKTETNPKGLKDVDFRNEIQTAKEEVEYLKSEGADIIIALAHIGTGKQTAVTSTDLAKAMEGSGLNLIIDGHGKNSTYFTESGITVIHAGSDGEFAGSLGIDISDNGTVEITPLILTKAFFDNIEADKETSDVINMTLNEQNTLLSQVVSYSNTTLWGGKIGSVSEGRVHETNLGDFICDKMIEKASSVLGKKNIPIVAVENGGGIRASIPMGDVTWNDVINVLPFSNNIVCKEVTPKIIYDMLELSVSSIKAQDRDTGKLDADTNGNFLQVGGMSFKYNPNAAEGNKVSAVYLDGKTQSLDKNDTKTRIILVSNDYIMGGGDNFDMLCDIPKLGECGGLADMLTEALRSYNSDTPLTYPITQNRIVPNGEYDKNTYTAKIYVKNADGTIASDADITYYVDARAQKGKTNENGILSISVTNGPHGVTIDKKTEVYINNYSGSGIDGNYPQLIR